MTTGLRQQTFMNLQLNAGVFLKNFDFSTAKDKAELETAVLQAMDEEENAMGATRGGGTFVCKPTIRSIEADGRRGPMKGGEVIDMWEVKMTTTLLEITPSTFKDALTCCDTETSGSKTKLTVRMDIQDKDYIPHLVWVGDTSQGMVAIDLHNALNIAGANFTFTDRGEGTLPVEFQAHLESPADMEHLPVDVYFFDPA